jgi:alkanesulfonate monooxygenase SsuD/methylene tetrahydromethanopterin reductase-like flavin-dependent oxidoreductase (luciferase family)
MPEQGAQYDHIGSKYDEYARTATQKRAESHTFFRMVGALDGKCVLDLACGFGFYTRLLKQHGAAQAIRAVWERGAQAGAAGTVPDTLIATVAVAGTAAECRERIEAYRRSGITLPIIFPVLRSAGPAGKQEVIDALRACAP